MGNNGWAKNLAACTGECDGDWQCKSGLKCKQRENGERIPGCKGNGNGKTWDYCYDPEFDTTCQNIDECADATLNNCSTDSTCHDTIGSFACKCKKSGFVWDGKACVDVDECANGNPCANEPNQSCVNTPGSFECTCKSGYTRRNSKNEVKTLSGGNNGGARGLAACTGECDYNHQC